MLLRKCEPENCAATGSGVDPNLAAMALDDAFADRQADAGAGVFTLRVQAFENDE